MIQYSQFIKFRSYEAELQRIIDFLAKLITGSKTELADSIMFFPVLIRNNVNIVKNKDSNDYKNFVVNGVDNKNIENIILAFNSSINDFSNDIYAEAIGNE